MLRSHCPDSLTFSATRQLGSSLFRWGAVRRPPVAKGADSGRVATASGTQLSDADGDLPGRVEQGVALAGERLRRRDGRPTCRCSQARRTDTVAWASPTAYASASANSATRPLPPGAS